MISRIAASLLLALLWTQNGRADFSNYSVSKEIQTAVGYHQRAEEDRDSHYARSHEFSSILNSEARSPHQSAGNDAFVQAYHSTVGSASQERIAFSGNLRGQVVYSEGQPVGRYLAVASLQFHSDSYFYAEFAYNLDYKRSHSNAENPYASIQVEGGDPYSTGGFYRLLRENAEYGRSGYTKSPGGRHRELLPPGNYMIYLEARCLYRSRACQSEVSFSFVAQKQSFPEQDPTVQTLSPQLQLASGQPDSKDKLILLGKADRSEFAGITGFEFIDPTAYQPTTEILHSAGLFGESDSRFGFPITQPIPGFNYKYRAFIELNETKIFGEWVTYARPWPTTQITQADGQVKLSVQTFSGHGYQLEETTELGEPWVPVSGESFIGDNTKREASVPISGPKKFYRYSIEKLAPKPN